MTSAADTLDDRATRRRFTAELWDVMRAHCARVVVSIVLLRFASTHKKTPGEPGVGTRNRWSLWEFVGPL